MGLQQTFVVAFLVSGVAWFFALRSRRLGGGSSPATVMGSGTMFDAIAEHYDVANQFMSLGLDTSWRVAMIDALEVGPAHRVLDLATGTADVAILEGRRGAVVTGVDPSEKMLDVGRAKVHAGGLEALVTLYAGDAQALDKYGDASFDRITMAFGIRNVPDRDAALREIRRVAAPGAKVGILEFCLPESGILAPVARLFIAHVVPVLGSVFSGRVSTEEYAHLQKSIADFPSALAFADQIQAHGFSVDRPITFAAGSVALYLATPN